ncbi:MAG: RNA polymerase sigma-70 factor, partial [Bacteroidota bacterium]
GGTKVIDPDSHNDRVLFKKISTSDGQAFMTFFDLYKAELFGVAIRLTKSQVIAEEIVQEVFISLWISRQHLIRVEDPVSYTYRILLNKTGNYLKKEANQQRIIKDAIRYHQSSSDDTEQVVDGNETRRQIERALGQLPPKQKIVYILSRQRGLSNNEIASELHVSPHTVKSHLSKAIGFIRTYLEALTMVITWVTLNNFILF